MSTASEELDAYIMGIERNVCGACHAVAWRMLCGTVGGQSDAERLVASNERYLRAVAARAALTRDAPNGCKGRHQ